MRQRPTFARDVAPLLYRHCATCHHPGEAAPFSLLSYDDARRRAGQIAEVTQRRFMPPWLPGDAAAAFDGDRRLSEQQLQTLKAWADAGAPRGDAADEPPPPAFTQGWQAGSPDLILESPAYTLAAEGRDVFRNFVIQVPLDAPRWVQSIELRPENPRVTHHARLGIDTSNESLRRDAEDPEPGYEGMAWGQDPDGQLVIWAPGVIAHPGTPGVAWRLFPKSCLVLHTHLQPSGKPEVMKFRIGIRFAGQAPTIQPAMLRIGSCDIDIPPGATTHTISDHYVLPIDVDVHTVFPHAHSLCREVHITAQPPQGPLLTLLSIDHFDENWHDSYRYQRPIRLPRGTRLDTTFAYDNSDANTRNRHHPPRRVVYGSNADDEMEDVYLQVTAVHPDQRAVLMEDYTRYEMRAQIAGYRKSLDQDPGNPWSQEALATCLVGLGKPAQAATILEQRIKDGPPAVYPVVSLGMALLATGENPSAEAQLRRALTMDDQYPLAWLGLGRALAAQQKPAEQAYRRAVELAPGLADASLDLAELLIRSGNLDEAARLCTAATASSPDIPGLYLKLAEISARRKDYDQALAYFRSARDIAPYTHPPKLLLAISCIANGDLDRGLALAHEAKTDEPGYPVPSLILGQLALRQQQLDEARLQFDAAARIPIPDNWPQSHRQRFLVLLHSQRFRLAQQTNDPVLARDALEQWLQNDPDNPQVRKLYHDLNAREQR